MKRKPVAKDLVNQFGDLVASAVLAGKDPRAVMRELLFVTAAVASTSHVGVEEAVGFYRDAFRIVEWNEASKGSRGRKGRAQ